MKVRIRGDSIRLRLKRGEVDQLVAGSNITEKTHFPGTVLTSSLGMSDNKDIAASFDGGNIFVTVPKILAVDWANTDEVSLYADQPLEGSGSLALLIEKDFTCLEPGHHRDCDDDVDTFPHPNATAENT